MVGLNLRVLAQFRSNERREEGMAVVAGQEVGQSHLVMEAFQVSGGHTLLGSVQRET